MSAEKLAFLEGLAAGMGVRIDVLERRIAAIEEWKRGLVGVVEPAPPPEQGPEMHEHSMHDGAPQEKEGTVPIKLGGVIPC